MATLLEQLSKVRTKQELLKVLKREFKNRGFKPNRPSVEKFVQELKREFPKLDRLVEKNFNGNGLLEIMEDEYRIP